MTPWILVDFKSPRRNLPVIQDGWNRKGLISDQGYKKQAFYVLKEFYDKLEKEYSYTIKD
jgi:beta-glucuronidase